MCTNTQEIKEHYGDLVALWQEDVRKRCHTPPSTWRSGKLHGPKGTGDSFSQRPHKADTKKVLCHPQADAFPAVLADLARKM